MAVFRAADNDKRAAPVSSNGSLDGGLRPVQDPATYDCLKDIELYTPIMKMVSAHAAPMLDVMSTEALRSTTATTAVVVESHRIASQADGFIVSNDDSSAR